jgi:hypothetical protein
MELKIPLRNDSVALRSEHLAEDPACLENTASVSDDETESVGDGWITSNSIA